MATQSPVPTFYLYGEPHRSAADNFLHVEHLADRSLPAGWTIRPHAHRDLDHLFLISAGGGTMQADGELRRFEAPCLIVVPSGVVHGFHWHDDSSGSVITLSSTYRDELVRRDADVAAVCGSPAVSPLTREAARVMAGQARLLTKELAWAAPGHRMAIDGALATILVQAVRGLTDPSLEQEQSRGRHAELVARFRALVEDRFRTREPVVSYAARLGVSPTTLRTACASVAGKPPVELINLRTLLEAKRALCYTNQTVAEIAYHLGFVDPAYFTRSFTKHAGVSPRKYRAQHEVTT
jgi:AraC family transcriptional activator of pobA